MARVFENIKQRLTNKPHTLGVMQVKSNKLITDYESVKLGTEKVVNAYNQYLQNLKDAKGEFNEYSAYYGIVSNYNGGSSYHGEVADLISIIKENFYKGTKDSLDPNKKNAL